VPHIYWQQCILLWILMSDAGRSELWRPVSGSSQADVWRREESKQDSSSSQKSQVWSGFSPRFLRRKETVAQLPNHQRNTRPGLMRILLGVYACLVYVYFFLHCYWYSDDTVLFSQGCWFIAENFLKVCETFWGKMCGIWRHMWRIYATYMLHIFCQHMQLQATESHNHNH